MYFLGTNGRLYYAGSSNQGEDGQGGAIAVNVRSTPVLVGGGHTDIVEVWVGPYPSSVFYRRAGGAVLGFGDNRTGQLGIGSTTSQSTPQPIAALAGAHKIVSTAGGNAGLWGTSLAILADRTLVGTGYNVNGQIGDGTTTNRTSWVSASGLAAVQDVAIATFGASIALVEPTPGNRQVRTWGWNGAGECGLGHVISPQTSPQTPAGSWQGSVTTIATGGDYSAGSTAVCATYVQAGNEILATGANTSLNLVNGSTVNSNSFTRVLGLNGETITDWCVVGWFGSFGLFVRTPTGALAGGFNTAGECGVGGSANFKSGGPAGHRRPRPLTAQPKIREMTMTASNFAACLRIVLKHEGGYVDHPRDPAAPPTSASPSAPGPTGSGAGRRRPKSAR